MKTIEKIKVPADYYNEMTSELFRSWNDAKNAPARQLKRIKAVIKSGKDHEVMSHGTVSLDELINFYQEAKAVDVDALKIKHEEFTASHEIDPRMTGDIVKAKKEIDEYCKIYVGYNDSENNYELLHSTSHKYFLSEKQMDKLMEYMMEKGYMD